MLSHIISLVMYTSLTLIVYYLLSIRQGYTLVWNAILHLAYAMSVPWVYPLRHGWSNLMSGSSFMIFTQMIFLIRQQQNFPFKASNSWLRSFFARHGFSIWKIGTRINKSGVTGNMIDAICDFHPPTRVLQLSERNDSEYGFTYPANVYSHDQVPIALCSSYIKTIDGKGTDEVYDATAKGRDLKCFCSLNLFAPLR